MASIKSRPEGSFGDAFASLSKNSTKLPARFLQLKRDLADNKGDAILRGWHRLLKHLNEELLPLIRARGSELIPEIDYEAIAANNGYLPADAERRLRECGTIIVRGLIPEQQALQWKRSIGDYAQANPSTKGFPSNNKQIYELYWSKPQLEARSHENMLATQVALNKAWHAKDTDEVVLSEAVAYCDRLRIRTPGDTSFNLGPHLDGGSLERWEDPEYRRCYTQILQGNWENHDAFDVSPRLNATIDMYKGPGGCSAFRTFQGWLSLSDCSPGEGTLRVVPDLKASTAYTILRPFVTLTDGNWTLDVSSPEFHGAAMGAGQELLPDEHSHLAPDGFVSIPRVRPGDAVFWHCDVAHMVENEHTGTQDASVLYIPSTPLCKLNADYLLRQRTNFLDGVPPPDFPGGIGESQHVGRGVPEDLDDKGRMSMGLSPLTCNRAATEGESAAYMMANKVLARG